MANPQPPFRLFSVAFGGTNEAPLPMRDLQSNLVIGVSPEWVVKRRSAPAAYSIGTNAQLSVVFQADNIDVFPQGKRFTIQASGGPVTLVPQTVPLAMNPKVPLSKPIVFPCAAPIKGGIGIRTFTLKWTATDESGQTFAIGSSSHTIYVTWQPAPAGTVPPFEVVARAAVDAAAGTSSVADITEDLIDAVGTLGLERSLTGGNVRMALLQKAADSGGFSALLVQMLAVHGIPAATRAISVDWQHLPTTALEWVATTTAAPLAAGSKVHCVTLIPVTGGLLLCDADLEIDPIFLPIALPEDKPWTLTGAVFKTVLSKYLKPAAKRSLKAPMPVPGPSGPVTPFSVHFRFPESQAIVLRDVVQDVEIGQTPEWVAGMDSFPSNDGPDDLGPPPAAYVCGTSITMEVTFLRTLDLQDGGAERMTLTIGATGSPAGVTAQNVLLEFDDDGRSQAVAFEVDREISEEVGVTTLTLDWYVRPAAGSEASIGSSVHPLYFTWQVMTANPQEDLFDWAYAQIVKWTSTFAAGATSDREVCDGIFRNLEKTGLKYGVPGWSPRQMIVGGQGGMCGGWYKLFQTMVHSQGVFVEKVGFLVDYRAIPGGSPTPAIQWNAIVMSNGGINQPSPTVAPSEFHDLAVFPIPSPAALKTLTARRYRFWGNPDPNQSDGHGINFLVSGGTLILYDPSFLIGPVELSMPLPQPKQVLGGAQLAEFVAKYLTIAVSHMLGSFTVNGKAMTSKVPVGAAPGVNGVSVVTAALPETAGGVSTITFAWM